MIVSFIIKLISEPTFLGSLIGAMLTGGVAIFITTSDRKYSRKRERKQELNALVKELKQLHYYIQEIYKRLNRYIQDEKDYDKVKKTNINLLEKQNSITKDLNSIIAKLETIDRKEFTVEMYNFYIEIIDSVQFELIPCWNEFRSTKNINALSLPMANLKRYLDDLERYHQKSLEELTRI